ncbi:MAG: leucine--tRNA ligase [Planctomycetota bacterium]
MTNAYDPAEIERRWQARWAEQRTFRTPNPGDPDFDPNKPKYYVLDMFPYPSGAGLHVGHPMGYIGSDVVARKKRMDGMNVLHPMGYDAFGLPAEQYAITTGKHPAETTAENVANFRRQMQLIGLSYDWDRELSTCEPSYYRWTQWIFARLYDRGLAYQEEVPVWWCEALKTVLANEEVIDGRSERGDHPCVRRPLKQWMLRITAYADRLIDDLELLDWPESVKTMQREWIGRSEGAEIDFEVAAPTGAPSGRKLRVFTTRPDTLYGATFCVLAPEHPLVAAITTDDRRADVDAYVAKAATKSDLDRTDLAKEKTGVFTGAYALNPLEHPDDPRAKVPIWVADYVLASYGTGAIMCVPGHDERDFEFARTFDLPIRRVVGDDTAQTGDLEAARTEPGVAVNSPLWDGLPTAEAKKKAIDVFESKGVGTAKVTYRLRDWLFSRQRYWGEPFPVFHHADGHTSRVPDEALPVELPAMTDFAPSDDGSPPLARATDWVETTHPVTGERVRRDTDTMPGWAGSCWYYLRFMDPTNANAPFSKDAAKYWQSVDLYIGGTEHAVLHLLYARFWHKVLYDEGLVPTKEPFQRLFNQGMLTAYAYKDSTGRLIPVDEVEFDGDVAKSKESGEELQQIAAKMSKSLKNVVNPDDVCAQYGVDTFRLYEMFMGPLADSKPWNPRDVPGCRRFLERAWRVLVDPDGDAAVRPNLLHETEGAPEGASLELERALNRALERIDASFDKFNFNTAVAALMTFVNDAFKTPEALRRDQAERFVLALSPFAPHVAEELWSRLGHEGSVAKAAWPALRPEYLVADTVEIAIQVNGKMRGRVQVPAQAPKDEVETAARAEVAKWLETGDVKKVVVVPGRLVNFVVA